MKQRVPFLTAIHLWDKKSDDLLLLQHDPLKIGKGEAGLALDDNCLTSSSRSGKRTSPLKTKQEDYNGKTISIKISNIVKLTDLRLEKTWEQVIAIKFQLMTYCVKIYLSRNCSNWYTNTRLTWSFLEDNYITTPESKKEILQQMKDIFEIIKNQGRKKRPREW